MIVFFPLFFSERMPVCISRRSKIESFICLCWRLADEQVQHSTLLSARSLQIVIRSGPVESCMPSSAKAMTPDTGLLAVTGFLPLVCQQVSVVLAL
jgi:hypothetical protein